MSVVEGNVRATLTRATGQTVNLTQAADFTSVSMTTKDFAPVGDTTFAFLDTIVPRIKNRVGATSLQVSIFGRNRLEEPLTLLGVYPLDVDDKPIFPQPLQSMVFYRAQFLDTRLAKRWALFGFQLFGEPDGQYI